MTRHGVMTMSLVVLLLSACDKKAPKSQFEREYETMVERCKVVATKGEETLCERRSTEASHRQVLAGLHWVMIDQITRLLPPSGSCSIHGASYLICQHTVGGTRSTIYRLDVAPDGSGNQVMSVWSRQSWSRQ
ncbi:MAG: hypothetical protein DME08_14425 [Candidatus Rokuibacteriota bacterium]|nr:MAG: hypothetical protein DME08_14425 [Candidatus Rokubacteria bacterium]